MEDRAHDEVELEEGELRASLTTVEGTDADTPASIEIVGVSWNDTGSGMCDPIFGVPVEWERPEECQRGCGCAASPGRGPAAMVVLLGMLAGAMRRRHIEP